MAKGNAPPIAQDFEFGHHSPKAPVKIGLALQGGGSYGAFTAGVIKALMEDTCFQNGAVEIIGVTGTSAGANNGVVLCDALNNGGPRSVTPKMRRYWNDVKANGQGLEWMSHFTFWARFPNLPKPFIDYAKMLGKLSVISPQDILRSLIDKHVSDWDGVNNGKIKLFTNAAKENPRTGDVEHIIFNEHSPDTIVASANLRMFGPLKRGGYHYYDGAERHNPAIEPLEELDGLTDIIAINLHKNPGNAYEAAHQRDVRSSECMGKGDLITHHIAAHMDHIHAAHEKDYHLHEIALIPQRNWDDTSRVNVMPSWIDRLYDMGYQTGKQWLKDHGYKLGVTSSYVPSHEQQTADPNLLMAANG